MKIVGISNLNHTDADKFLSVLNSEVNRFQEDNQEVEVQYQVGTFPNGQIVLNALIIGRK